MVEEMVALNKNEAWDLVELEVGRKWMFKKKMNAKCRVEK